MAAPINLQANVQIQNLSQMQRQIQQATQNLKINMGGGNAARSLSALSQPLGRLTGQADEFSKSLDAANARVLAFGASVGIVNTLSNAFKSLVNSTIEVEKAITAISVVGDQFAGKSKQLSQGLFSIAKATGQSFEEVSKAALEFSRQGLKLEDTLQRTQDALILTRLTGLDASKSVDGLTASVNAFAKAGLSTTQILNKLAAVDQAFAVSSADLIEGFNRSAAVAQNAGVTFDELAGIITTLQQETSRGGAVIGNALKTIFTRLQDTSTLNQLKGLGVAVQDLEGNLLPARQILQNLAKDVEGLGQITRAGIFKDVAGTFQINQLISLVGDLGRANSVTAKATKVSAGATNEAFTANQKLNQSLDAIINKVSLTGKQLGALLGEIGLGDNLKGILDGINSFLEGATDLLQGDDLGSRFAKGIVKGIGSVLTGPGIGLFLAIIAKLSFDLAKFGVQSLKTFFNIGQAAKEQKLVQESIVQTLIRNQSVLSQIVNTQGGQNAQAQAFLNILRQEEQALQNIRTLAGGIAAPVIAQGYRPSPQGLSRGGSAAGGYLPAQEASDVRRGVGGASPSSKVVSIPNFAFGGGKRGTMIANTSEYIVPNYAGGGSAIFNQDMVKTMGLPPGAKKITASGGFVPNFASIKDIAKYNPRIEKNLLLSSSTDQRLSPTDIVNLRGNTFNQQNVNLKQGESAIAYEDRVIKELGYQSNNLLKYQGSSAVDGYKIKGNQIDLLEVKSGNWNSYEVLNKFLRALPENYGTKNILDLWSKNRDVFTVNASVASPISKNFKATQKNLFKKASSGYIPNFANYIYDSDRLGNSSTKILDAILASPAKKNLLSAPAGAGKSTYAASMGKFIKSINDVLNVSENDYFTILSGAGLTEAGAMSVGFSEILASVNKSGGKVSYLNVPDEEIKSRRFSRLGSTSDLRNEAQLRATINAPLNEPKFVDYLKGGAKNFDLINEDDKNDQLAVLGLYGNNGKINGSPVYTLESQRPELFKDIKANLQKNVVKLVRGYASRISKSVGVPVIGKDIEKSLNQIPSLSGFMFEDILNQLAGPNFDSNKISGGSRADFPLNDELKRVFGVSGSQKYAEIKLNPFSSDAISSVIAKQRALARGAIAPKEFDPVQVAKWRETAIGIKLGMGGKRAKEASGIRSRLAREMIEAGAIQSYTKQDAETAAIKKYLGLASGGYIPNFAAGSGGFDGDGTLSTRDAAYAKLKTTLQKASKNPVARFAAEQVLQNLLGLPEGVETLQLIKACYQALKFADQQKALDEVSRQAIAEKKKAKRQAYLRDNASNGFMPNFASDALQAAISRERSAGISASQIYVDQSPALKSAANPMGLMVANRRDEPAGGFQGISRARREGMNPKTYGAARGFVPNYAPVQAAHLGTFSPKITSSLNKFAELINKLNKELSQNKITFDKAQDAVNDFVKGIKSGKGNLDPSRGKGKQLAEAAKSRLEAPTSNAPTGQFADLAGKLVVAQTAMSFFTGAVEGSGGQLEKLGTSITQVAGSLGQLFFLLSSFKGGQALIGKFTDKLKGFGNSIKGALPNLLGARGAASRAGGLVSGIGTKLPGIGVALTAGYVIKTLADGVKGFFTKDLSATFDGLGEAASVASSQLTDFGKTLATDEIRAASSNFFASFGNSILEFLTAGTADITSFIDNAGQKRTIESLGTANEEQLGKIVNDLITANIATGNATARTSAFNFLENLPGNTKGNYGQTKINFEDPKLIEALKDEFKRLGIEAEAYNKKQAFATAQKFAQQETEALIDRLQINKNLISALNSQYQALRDTVLNIDLESVFSKSANKTLLDLNSSFSSAEKSIGEFKNSLSEIKIDFEADKAKALAAELEKINTIASDSLAKLGAEVTNETSTAITGLQNIFSDTTKNADDLRNFLTKNAKDLVNIIDTEEAIKQFEAYRKQSLELERQVKLKQFQTKLDFTNKTLIDQQTLSIQKQNSVLDKQLSIIDKRISMQDKELELTRRIEDTQFERGLVGKSEPAKIQAQITRERGTLRDRAIQDVLNDFKRQIIDGFKEISIPENISPDQALTFRQRIKGGVETISGLARTSGETPEQFGQRIAGQYSSLAKSLAKDINDAEKAASKASFDQIKLSGDIFKTDIEIAGQIFIDKISSIFPQSTGISTNNQIPFGGNLPAQPKLENNQDFSYTPRGWPSVSDMIEKDPTSLLLGGATSKYKELETAIVTDLQISDYGLRNKSQTSTISIDQGKLLKLQERRNELEKQRGELDKQNLQTSEEYIQATSNLGNIQLEIAAITEESNTRLAEFSQSLSQIGDSAQILSQRIRDYFIGLPAELASLQFGALQSTSPDDLASNLIQQDVLLKNKGSEKENVESIAQQTALRQKSFELQTAESASRRRELEIELQYLEEFFDLKQRTANLSEEDRIAQLAALKRRQIEEQRTFGAGLGRGFAQLETDVENFQSQLGEQIPQLFSDNLAQGLNDAISGAKSLKDALRDAATSFFQEITRQNISNLAKMFTSGIGNVAQGFFGAQNKATGGLISGGSGVKDDVPAMLMGGEYVIKKSSVQKYGSKFLDSLNRGSIKGFASGGGVQSGSGGFYAPGEYGTGGIRGKRELLSFATQSFSSGQYDTMGGFGMSGASVSLEAESSRLSQFGRQNNPMFERVQESKQQAFDVYLNQLKQEEQYQEQLKEMERRDKERQKQLVTSIVSAVASSALSIGASAFNAGASNAAGLAKSQGAGFLGQTWAGLKGGLGFGGGTGQGGLGNLFSGNFSSAFTNYSKMASIAGTKPNYISSGGQYKGVTIGNTTYLPENTFSGGVLNTGGNSNFNGMRYDDRTATRGDYYFNPSIGTRGAYGYNSRASGGMVSGGSGMRDDVPAMLTGGEFVLNNRATRKLGVQNLNRLNAGETNTGEGDSSAVTESLISKLDELIQATRESAGDNVVVNVSSNEAQAKTENTNGNEKELQRKIKQAVLDVIAQEKRLGGSLTKGK